MVDELDLKCEKLRKVYNLTPNSGVQVISSLNNWIAAKMVDIRVYCQILKGNLPDFKG